jgi:hypothetical protein
MRATSLLLCPLPFTWACSFTHSGTCTHLCLLFVLLDSVCDMFMSQRHKEILSCGNVATCSPSGQINLNIGDNSLDTDDEFYSSPKFHIYTVISMFKSYKVLRTWKKMDSFELPFDLTHLLVRDLLSPPPVAVQLYHCVNLIDRGLENITDMHSHTEYNICSHSVRMNGIGH